MTEDEPPSNTGGEFNGSLTKRKGFFPPITIPTLPSTTFMPGKLNSQLSDDSQNFFISQEKVQEFESRLLAIEAEQNRLTHDNSLLKTYTMICLETLQCLCGSDSDEEKRSRSSALKDLANMLADSHKLKSEVNNIKKKLTDPDGPSEGGSGADHSKHKDGQIAASIKGYEPNPFSVENLRIQTEEFKYGFDQVRGFATRLGHLELEFRRMKPCLEQMESWHGKIESKYNFFKRYDFQGLENRLSEVESRNVESLAHNYELSKNIAETERNVKRLFYKMNELANNFSLEKIEEIIKAQADNASSKLGEDFIDDFKSLKSSLFEIQTYIARKSEDDQKLNEKINKIDSKFGETMEENTQYLKSQLEDSESNIKRRIETIYSELEDGFKTHLEDAMKRVNSKSKEFDEKHNDIIQQIQNIYENLAQKQSDILNLNEKIGRQYDDIADSLRGDLNKCVEDSFKLTQFASSLQEQINELRETYSDKINEIASKVNNDFVSAPMLQLTVDNVTKAFQKFSEETNQNLTHFCDQTNQRFSELLNQSNARISDCVNQNIASVSRINEELSDMRKKLMDEEVVIGNVKGLIQELDKSINDNIKNADAKINKDLANVNRDITSLSKLIDPIERLQRDVSELKRNTQGGMMDTSTLLDNIKSRLKKLEDKEDADFAHIQESINTVSDHTSTRLGEFRDEMAKLRENLIDGSRKDAEEISYRYELFRNSVNEQLNDNKQVLDEIVEHSQNQFDKLNKSIIDINEQMSQGQRDFMSLSDKLSKEHQEAFSEIRNDTSKNRQELQELQNAFSNFEQRLSEIRDTHTKKLDDIDNRVSQNMIPNDSFQNALTDLQNMFQKYSDGINTQIDQYNQQNSLRLNDYIKQTDERLDSHILIGKTQVNEYSDRFDMIYDKLKEYDTKIQNTSILISDMDKRINDGLSSNEDRLLNDIGMLNKELESIQRAIEPIEYMDKEIKNIRELRKVEEIEIGERVENELKEFREQIVKIQKDGHQKNNDLLSVIEELKDKFSQDTDKACDNLLRNIANLNQRIDEIQYQMDQKQLLKEEELGQKFLDNQNQFEKKLEQRAQDIVVRFDVKLGEVDGRLSEFQALLDIKSRDLETLHSRFIDEQDVTVDELKNDIHKCNERISKTRGQIEELQNQISALQDASKDKLSEINTRLSSDFVPASTLSTVVCDFNENFRRFVDDVNKNLQEYSEQTQERFLEFVRQTDDKINNVSASTFDSSNRVDERVRSLEQNSTENNKNIEGLLQELRSRIDAIAANDSIEKEVSRLSKELLQVSTMAYNLDHLEQEVKIIKKENEKLSKESLSQIQDKLRVLDEIQLTDLKEIVNRNEENSKQRLDRIYDSNQKRYEFLEENTQQKIDLLKESCDNKINELQNHLQQLKESNNDIMNVLSGDNLVKSREFENVTDCVESLSRKLSEVQAKLDNTQEVLTERNNDIRNLKRDYKFKLNRLQHKIENQLGSIDADYYDLSDEATEGIKQTTTQNEFSAQEVPQGDSDANKQATDGAEPMNKPPFEYRAPKVIAKRLSDSLKEYESKFNFLVVDFESRFNNVKDSLIKSVEENNKRNNINHITLTRQLLALQEQMKESYTALEKKLDEARRIIDTKYEEMIGDIDYKVDKLSKLSKEQYDELVERFELVDSLFEDIKGKFEDCKKSFKESESRLHHQIIDSKNSFNESHREFDKYMDVNREMIINAEKQFTQKIEENRRVLKEAEKGMNAKIEENKKILTNIEKQIQSKILDNINSLGDSQQIGRRDPPPSSPDENLIKRIKDLETAIYESKYNRKSTDDIKKKIDHLGKQVSDIGVKLRDVVMDMSEFRRNSTSGFDSITDRISDIEKQQRKVVNEVKSLQDQTEVVKAMENNYDSLRRKVNDVDTRARSLSVRYEDLEKLGSSEPKKSHQAMRDFNVEQFREQIASIERRTDNNESRLNRAVENIDGLKVSLQLNSGSQVTSNVSVSDVTIKDRLDSMQSKIRQLEKMISNNELGKVSNKESDSVSELGPKVIIRGGSTHKASYLSIETLQEQLSQMNERVERQIEDISVLTEKVEKLEERSDEQLVFHDKKSRSTPRSLDNRSKYGDSRSVGSSASSLRSDDTSISSLGKRVDELEGKYKSLAKSMDKSRSKDSRGEDVSVREFHALRDKVIKLERTISELQEAADVYKSRNVTDLAKHVASVLDATKFKELRKIENTATMGKIELLEKKVDALERANSERASRESQYPLTRSDSVSTNGRKSKRGLSSTFDFDGASIEEKISSLDARLYDLEKSRNQNSAVFTSVGVDMNNLLARVASLERICCTIEKEIRTAIMDEFLRPFIEETKLRLDNQRRAAHDLKKYVQSEVGRLRYDPRGG